MGIAGVLENDVYCKPQRGLDLYGLYRNQQKISDLEISAVRRFIDLVALSNHPVCLPNQPLNTTFLLFLPLQCNVGNLDVCYNVLVVVSIFV